MSFDQSITFTLKEEGGYANHPADPGGATNMGIIQSNYDAFRLSIDAPRRPVRNIKLVEVYGIYYTQFWLGNRCDMVAEVNPGIGLFLFDTVVNCGGIGIKIMQHALGVKADGAIGPITLGAISKENSEEIIKRFVDFRMTYYRAVVRNKPQTRVFMNNWTTRTNRCARYANDINREAGTT